MSNFLYILKALMRRGPSFLLLYLRESLAFDIANGTNTHLRVPKAQQAGVASDYQDGLLYVASLTSVIRKSLTATLNLLGKRQFDEAQFFDLGCGKGKALLVYAMEYGQSAHHPAIGIEYDPSLCEIAVKNIRKLGAVRDRAIVHCDSALNIEQYINSKFLIVYLYNSFQGETLRSVLRTIAKYPHVLIYVDPVEKDILADYGYKVHVAHQGDHNASTWLVALNQVDVASPDPVDEGS